MIKNFKSWFKCAAIRAVKTFAQALVAAIPMGAAFLGAVNWGYVLSSAALAAIISIGTSLAGLPEVKEEQTDEATVEVKEENPVSKGE